MFLGVLHEISPPQSGNYNKAPKKLKVFGWTFIFLYFYPANVKKQIAFLYRIN